MRRQNFPSNRIVSRREVIGLGAAIVGGSLLAARRGRTDQASLPRLTVLAPTLPNPAPPGVAEYMMDGLSIWEGQHGTDVYFDATALENIKPKILINIRQGYYVHDMMYCAGWAQEIAQRLVPLDTLISPVLRNDLPPWSLSSFQWESRTYGVPSVANPMILYFNQDLLAEAGIQHVPSTWEELLDAKDAVEQKGATGWIFPGAQTGGIGGVMSSWQVFFLQAGGRLFGSRDEPTIANDAGVAAIEMLQGLLPTVGPSPLEIASLQDASVTFLEGKTAMMINWAGMYNILRDLMPADQGFRLGTAPLPAGPVGKASIDSGDGWTIDRRSWQSTRAMDLIQFFLQPRVQVQMYAATGWLPISVKAINDPVILAQAPHAPAVHEQLKSRIDSGFRPNFDVVTQVIGSEIRQALLGTKTPIGALRDATAQLNAASSSGVPLT